MNNSPFDLDPETGFDKAAEIASQPLNDLLYSKTDMINFAGFYYGTDIDTLDDDAQFECKRIDGALEYWTKHIR